VKKGEARIEGGCRKQGLAPARTENLTGKLHLVNDECEKGAKSGSRGPTVIDLKSEDKGGPPSCAARADSQRGC